ncbi:hypothetical protein VZT92_023754 [Zoarces viviparus]|uniref:Uncharacterized protein n=1 Tax=Zoarces viviparus TaxID=48416 RepID=A0AAW1E8B0_ZOAVI
MAPVNRTAQTLQQNKAEQSVTKHAEQKVQHSVKQTAAPCAAPERQRTGPLLLSEDPANSGRHRHYSSQRALTSATDTSWSAAITVCLRE